jgi:hypothetical protein
MTLPDIATVDPAILAAFNYFPGWKILKHRYAYRDWSLDSGAWAARAQGIVVDLNEYIATCQAMRDIDPTLHDIFALDVIGSWRETMKNTEAMWAAGVEAIPTYHFADDNLDTLMAIARDYPKIALGGMADLRGQQKRDFVEQCFGRVWPKKVHGFAVGDVKGTMQVPWDSTDASSWKRGTLRFGTWMSVGHLKVRSGRKWGVVPDLRSEIEAILRLERRHDAVWGPVKRKAFGESFDGVRLCLAADWTTAYATSRVIERAIGKAEKAKRLDRLGLVPSE